MKSLDELIKEAKDVKSVLRRAIFQNIFLILCNVLLLTAIFVFRNPNMSVFMKVLQFIAIALALFNTMRWTKDLVDYIKYYIKIYVIKEILEETSENENENTTSAQ